MKYELHRDDIETSRIGEESYVLDSIVLPITDEEDGTIGSVLSSEVMVKEDDSNLCSTADAILLNAAEVLAL